MKALTIEDDSERGQVGIGTLIVFIAMVLVAAIAAGVLINTAGFLQSQSEQTGQESTSQVSDRLMEVGVSAEVATGDGELENVSVTVTKAPGAGDISLTNVTAQWTGPQGTFNLLSNSADSDDTVTGQTFDTNAFKDASGSFPVLTSSDDRFIITFDMQGTGNNNAGDLGPVGESDEVLIEFTTESGGTTEVRFQTPPSLESDSSISL
jgi:flagellin FlaA/flagellin FlaB